MGGWVGGCVGVYGLETRKELELRGVGPRHLCGGPLISMHFHHSRDH